MMDDIAKLKDGSFYHILKLEIVGKCFADCIGVGSVHLMSKRINKVTQTAHLLVKIFDIIVQYLSTINQSLININIMVKEF